MKRIICFLLILAVVLSLGGCAAEKKETSAAGAGAVTFTDSLDREITVNEPKRVAVMIGSFADIWCLAGGKDVIVASAHDTWTSFDLGLSEDVIDIGSSKDPDLELLLSSEPDFIIASSNTGADLDLLDTFEEMKIPAAYFEVSTVEDYIYMLDICAKITGDHEGFVENGTKVLEQCEKAKKKNDGSSPTALYIRITGDKVKVKNSEDSVLGEMLKDLGAVNIADSEDSLLEELSMELIVKDDPDFIFAVFQGGKTEEAESAMEQIISNPAWQGLSAVKENRYYVLDEKLYNLKPNARWGQAYSELADILYP